MKTEKRRIKSLVTLVQIGLLSLILNYTGAASCKEKDQEQSLIVGVLLLILNQQGSCSNSTGMVVCVPSGIAR